MALLSCNVTKKKIDLDELLIKERSIYISTYKQGIKEFGTNKSVFEVMLRTTSDQNKNQSELFQSNRYDLINIDDKGKFNITEINIQKDSVLQFNSQTYDINGMALTIEPFVWNGCDFILDKKPNLTYSIWAKKWIDFEDNKETTKDTFLNLIHSVTLPVEINGQWHTSVDFGTAPVEAFKELVTTFSKQGMRHVEASSKAFTQ